MFNRILVVCIGNICRSPLAEAALRQLAPVGVSVQSAGLGALVGQPADPESLRQGQLHGLDLSQHVARQLTPALCAESDLILVMEDEHIDAVCRLSPSARGKVMLLGRWESGKQIPDPYRKSAEVFAHTYQLIAASSEQWARKMQWI